MNLIKNKFALLCLSLCISNTVLATERSFTVDKRYVWTIFDEPCGIYANPDKLGLKDAKVIDLQENKSLDGCALDDGTLIEFQIIIDKVRSLDLKFPTSSFSPVEKF